MKILIIGFLAFSGWSVLSTYLYVCDIKGLCSEPASIELVARTPGDVIADDTLKKPTLKEETIIPENLKIYFAFDKSEFNADAKTEKYFNESNAYLEKNSQARLSITGHTDAVGTDEYNQALGYRRAQSIQQYFKSKGMTGNTMIIVSKGEDEPADNNSTEAGRANNRRTEITIKK